MIKEYKTITGSFTLDGNYEKVEKYSPPAGELWMVDELRAVLLGDGSVTDTATKLFTWGIHGNTFSYGDESQINRNLTTVTNDTVHFRSLSNNFDRYLHPDNEIVIFRNSQVSDNSTVEYAIKLRRIL